MRSAGCPVKKNILCTRDYITNTYNSLKSTPLLDLPIRIRKMKKEHFQPSHKYKKKEKRTFPRATIPTVKAWTSTKRIEQGINHTSF